MADNNTTTKIIRTIIKLRSDTAANFEAVKDELKLHRGEVAITIPDDPTQPCSAKVGVDGEKTWGQLPYSFGPLANNGTGGEGGNPGFSLSADGKTLQIKSNVISIIGADNPENVGKSFRISDDGSAIEWFDAADETSVENNTNLINQVSKNLLDNYYNKADTDALVSKVFKFKGTKTSKAELDAIENPRVGDVLTVKEAGKEANLYVYAENENGVGYWEDFPLTIDLENYVLKVDFEAVKEKVNANETAINEVKSSVNNINNVINTITDDIDSLTTDVATNKGDISTIKTDLSALKDKVDNLPSGGGEGEVGDLTELTNKVDAIDEKLTGVDEYVESVKPTINSLPDTIFSGMEIQTLENGDMKILGTHINRDTDGVYNIGGEVILATLKAVTPNGKPGLMTGADKAKLDKLAELAEGGGEPNVIENVKVAGESLEVNSVDKSVNIPVASNEAFGVVKVAGEDFTGENPVEVDENGIMSVPKINISSLYADDDFVIDGGNAGA